jgi:Mg/Co/Ni transporter MgtE
MVLPVSRQPTTNKIATGKIVEIPPLVIEPPLDPTQLRDARESIRKANTDDGVAILLGVSEENAAQILAGLRSREAGALIQAIAVTQPKTAGTILKILSSSGAGHAVDFLSASVAASVLTAMPVRDAARILVRTSPRTGAQIVMELPHHTSVFLIKGMAGKRAVSMLEYVWPNTVAELFRQSDELRDKLLGQLDPEFRAQVIRHL